MKDMVKEVDSIEFKEELLPYNEKYLTVWTENIPNRVQKILPKKLLCVKASLADRKRDDSRYFAEVTIARMWEPYVKDGWYGSYSWLHSRRWSECDFKPSGEQWQREHKKNFHDALRIFIKLKVIRDLQIVADSLSKTLHLKVRKGPDLFFVRNDRRLEFVEAKHDDPVRDHQIASLALLKRCLNASVRIIRVYPAKNSVHAVDLTNLKKSDDYTSQFSEYYFAVGNCIKNKAEILKILT